MLSKDQLLIADFYDIPNVLHYENLQLCLRLGLKLKKIHGILEFNQSQRLKPYIEFNAQK